MATNAGLVSYINSLSPAVYWRLDEASGTSFAQTGSSTAGAMTASGTVTASDATLIPGDATEFVTFGVGGYASAARGNITVPLTDVTISYLIRFYPPYTSSANIFALSLMGSGDSSSTTNVQTYQYFTPTTGIFNEIMEYGTGVNELIESISPMDPRFAVNGIDNTFMITTVRNSVAKQLSTYVNGVLFDRQTYVNNATGGTAAGVVWSLGNNTAVGIAAGGSATSMGHVCVFTRLLSEQEIRDMADAAGRLDAAPGQLRFDMSAATGPASNFLETNVVKTLLCAVDPLVDISVAFPSEAYTTEE
jgi:hypothetical protein